ncbi:doublesex- and mab-3-related transcription factor 1-like [Triticum dicoccoides]|uniref:doublesex- and mab-3-related transcription factor 1-like n=1 Tax=Triticum dicoccoides TaxID=85692 RepID=UPI00188E35D0|nr:doublesex- and mab-3-related transcription factor 1-like [Triticum dicoccoides]
MLTRSNYSDKALVMKVNIHAASLWVAIEDDIVPSKEDQLVIEALISATAAAKSLPPTISFLLPTTVSIPLSRSLITDNVLPPCLQDSSSCWNTNHNHLHLQQIGGTTPSPAGPGDERGINNNNHGQEGLMAMAGAGGGGGDGGGFSVDGEGRGTGNSKPMPMSERARLAGVPRPVSGLNCPRCDSTNTKFCYFNNCLLSGLQYSMFGSAPLLADCFDPQDLGLSFPDCLLSADTGAYVADDGVDHNHHDPFLHTMAGPPAAAIPTTMVAMHGMIHLGLPSGGDHNGEEGGGHHQFHHHQSMIPAKGDHHQQQQNYPSSRSMSGDIADGGGGR